MEERRERREVVVASGGQFLSSILSHLIFPFFSPLAILLLFRFLFLFTEFIT